MKGNLHLKVLMTSCLLFSTTFGFAQVWMNGQNARYAVAAPDLFTTGNTATTDSTFESPVAQVCFALDAKHKCFYVADFFGNRVLRFTYPVINDQPNANLVFGQPSFTSNIYNNGGISASGLASPCGITVDSISGTLWVLDSGNNRILRFDSAHKNLTNNPNANAVFGQPNFTTSAPATSQSGLKSNTSPQVGNLLYYDHTTGALWVSDNGNFRVIKYNSAKIVSNGPAAAIVLGQSAFTASVSAVNALNFGRPDGISITGGALFVSDPVGNRILRFNNVYSKTNGASADAVIGQPNFFSNTPGTSAINLNYPLGLTTDGAQRLYVCDRDNGRVLIYDNAPANVVANTVLWAFSLNTPGNMSLSPSTGGNHSSISIEPVYKQLFVLDRTHNRVVIFTSCTPAAISGNTLSCLGIGTTLSSNSVGSYTWSNGSNSVSILVNPTVNTTYSVVISPSVGCILSNTAVVSVSVIPSPTVLAATSSPTLCPGQNATLTAYGGATYLWNTLATTSIIVVSPGTTTTYSVTGYGSNGCPDEAVVTQSVVVCAGINEINRSISNFIIYPNPFTDTFFIESQTKEPVQIYNSMGQLIIVEDIINNHAINMKGQPSGIYTIRTNNSTLKLIKLDQN